MARYFLLEDDYVVSEVWQSLIRQVDVEGKVSVFPSVSALRQRYPDVNKIEEDCDVIISDIFLSGDETGVDFIKLLTPEMQLKTVLSSSVKADKGDHLLQENGLKCQYLEKPFNFAAARTVLRRLAVIPENNQGSQPKTLDKITSHTPVFLITGANSGIGLALADLLSQEKSYRLALTAREKGEEFLRKRFVENENSFFLVENRSLP